MVYAVAVLLKWPYSTHNSIGGFRPASKVEMMEERKVVLASGATVSLHGARRAGKSTAAKLAREMSSQPKTKPNSFYKQREIKRLMKRFMEEGVSKARARELAKIWYQMSDEQRAEVMQPDKAYDEKTKRVVFHEEA